MARPTKAQTERGARYTERICELERDVTRLTADLARRRRVEQIIARGEAGVTRPWIGPGGLAYCVLRVPGRPVNPRSRASRRAREGWRRRRPICSRPLIRPRLLMRARNAPAAILDALAVLERRHAERHDRRVEHALRRAAVRDYAARRWA